MSCRTSREASVRSRMFGIAEGSSIPASASQTACKWASTRSRFASSSAGGRTTPRTIATRPIEVILVVRALRRAIGHDERGLPRAAGSAAALGIVCRRRRHVAHIDGVQGGDVDAELHRRRTEKNRQEVVRLARLTHFSPFLRQGLSILVSPTKAPLAPLAAFLVHLRGVLSPFEAEQPFSPGREQIRERLVKPGEISIRASTVRASCALRRNAPRLRRDANQGARIRSEPSARCRSARPRRAWT